MNVAPCLNTTSPMVHCGNRKHIVMSRFIVLACSLFEFMNVVFWHDIKFQDSSCVCLCQLFLIYPSITWRECPWRHPSMSLYSWSTAIWNNMGSTQLQRSCRSTARRYTHTHACKCHVLYLGHRHLVSFKSCFTNQRLWFVIIISSGGGFPLCCGFQI